jgi:hypothetical protein
MSERAVELDRPAAEVRAPRERHDQGWVGSLGIAAAVVFGDPRLWLVGTAAFLLRGGWLVLALPIWVLPSPVAISSLLGPDAVGPAGPSLRAVTVALAVALGLLVMAAAAVVGGALADLVSLERFVEDAETAAIRSDRTGRQLGTPQRLHLALEAAGIQATMLVPAAIVFVYLVVGLVDSVTLEYLVPGSLAVPLAIRVVSAVAGPLAILVALVVAGDLLATVISRRLMARRLGVLRVETRTESRLEAAGPVASGLGQLVRHPGSMLATAALAWLITIALLAPALGAVVVAWGGARTMFLAQPRQPDPGFLAAWAFVTVLFVALWCAALLLAGVASALRAALWSAEALR